MYGQDEYIGLDQDVLKTSSEDVYFFWWRRLQDVFWGGRRKTSSKLLDQDECLLDYVVKQKIVISKTVLKMVFQQIKVFGILSNHF